MADENFATMTCRVKFPAKTFGNSGGFRAVVECQSDKYQESFPVKSWSWPGEPFPLSVTGASLRMTYRVRNGKTDRTDSNGKAIYETYLEPISIEPLGAAEPADKVARVAQEVAQVAPCASAHSPEDDLPF